MSKPSSSYDTFTSVDDIVSKPIVGSDGAASWQTFRREKGYQGSVAPKAPLKKTDRLAFSSWNDERQHESQLRKDQGEQDVGAGYTVFRDKSAQEEAAQRKVRKRIEQRIRPDKVPYFLPATTFQGWKFDYVFTTKEGRGTGYYWDGMDSVKKLRGELQEEPEGRPKLDNTYEEATEVSPVEDMPKKRKRKKEGPVIISDPNNPLEQVATLMQRRNASTLDLPPGWETATDPFSGRLYYFNRNTGERTWDKHKVSDLPEGWSSARDAGTGKEYFYNAATKETRWDRPSE